MSTNVLSGAKLAGGHPKDIRVENDFYATNPEATKMLLEHYHLRGKHYLEPCVGAGHIASVLQENIGENISITCIDIIDRGYPNTIVCDFLNWETDQLFDTIVTNPPYSLAGKFVEKCMQVLQDGGQLAMFLKIQFLEGAKRKELFKAYPPKYVYVFRNRMPTWNNGRAVDPSTGKRWATTMCHAWFIWEKGSSTEPIVRWL